MAATLTIFTETLWKEIESWGDDLTVNMIGEKLSNIKLDEGLVAAAHQAKKQHEEDAQ